MLYPLMNIVGPILLLAALIWAVFYVRGRNRRIDKVSDDGARNLRNELNAEDTGGRPRP